MIAVSATANGSAPGRRRRRAAALAACHLLLFVVLPAAHAALPMHGGAEHAHACPFCQSLLRGIDAVPAADIDPARSVDRAVPLRAAPVAAIPAAADHDPAAPRAPPLA